MVRTESSSEDTETSSDDSEPTRRTGVRMARARHERNNGNDGRRRNGSTEETSQRQSSRLRTARAREEEEDINEEDEEDDQMQYEERIRPFRDEDEYIGKRLPHVIKRQQLLSGDTWNRCPLCFHNLTFQINGNNAKFISPISTATMSTVKRMASRGIRNGTLEHKDSFEITYILNESFTTLNNTPAKNLRPDINYVKYDKITPRKVYIHFMEHEQSTTNSLSMDIFDTNRIVRDMSNSESMMWMHTKKITSTGAHQIVYNHKTLKMYTDLLNAKNKSIQLRQKELFGGVDSGMSGVRSNNGTVTQGLYE